MTRQHLHFFLNRHLGNFPDTQAFWKLPKFLQVFEGGIFLRFWKFLKRLDIWGISKKPRHLGNFQDTQAVGKFPRYPGSWEISQIFRHLGNFPMSDNLGNSLNVLVFWEFPKCLGILEISSHLRNFHYLKNIPHSNICRLLGNFPDTKAFGKFPKFLQVFGGGIFFQILERT